MEKRIIAIQMLPKAYDEIQRLKGEETWTRFIIQCVLAKVGDNSILQDELASLTKKEPKADKSKPKKAKTEVTKQVSPELERAAAQRARDRANAARWNLDVAIFLFAVVIIVIILSFQGIGVEIVAPVAIFGLAMAWLVGWRQGKQLYERFYDEELSRGEIVVMCAWCGKEMRRERGLGQSIASHGICPECIEKHFHGLRAGSKAEEVGKPE